MLELTGKNFDTEIDGPLPVLVLWGTTMDVNSNRIALEMMKLDPTKVKIAHVDIDKSPDLVMRFSVRQSPYMVLWIRGIAMEEGITITDEMTAIINEGNTQLKLFR
jgi:thioredoxin-like negative regulator of GroEL